MGERTSTVPRKRGRPTEGEREERREQILDAAVGLFVAQGYGQVTIDEIAAAARVTKRTIYTYFGDKAEVFTAAVERFRGRALADLGDGGQTLEELAARLVLVLHSDDAVGLHRLMIGESSQFPDLAERFYDSGPRGYIALLEQRIPQRDGESDAASKAEALFGLLLGERHRRRLLSLTPAPDLAAAKEHAAEVIALFGWSAAP
ncbi:TetR/AcrR family transcriptional regulator [Microbacterium sp. MYb66]|uniref:TetR/AcrR family transcriptional regulator n=1 Tax=Microbacterium sp. MYb66 TaxID=1848692 RepID=UPI000D009323|nr:TetR/AcrR family transcriptional regulator [Microbacterium sp. MYb66]PRA82151.1 TetR family transcriptional regulator [Microbacterium sp. MYb66]